MTNRFRENLRRYRNGEVAPSEERRRQRLEREAPRQAGMGDLAAEFRDVRRGFDSMTDRIPDPILTAEAERRGLDQIDDRADMSAESAAESVERAADKFEPERDTEVDPGGVDLDLDIDEMGGL